MKKISMALLLFVLLASLFSSACYEDDTNKQAEVAVRNSTGSSLLVKIGSQSYGTLANGVTSGYKKFDIGKVYTIYMEDASYYYMVDGQFGDSDKKIILNINNPNNPSGWTTINMQ